MRYILTPAYGRSYTNRAAVLKAWHSGLDFVVDSGRYINKTDLKVYGVQYGVQELEFRRLGLASSFVLTTAEALSDASDG